MTGTDGDEGTEAEAPDVLSAENALKQVRADTLQEDDPEKRIAVLEAQLKSVNVDGKRKFFALRQQWSSVIITWISLLILFNSVLAIAIGTGSLDFSEYEWFITAVTVETFLQVVGLGYVAAKYLFSDGK